MKIYICGINGFIGSTLKDYFMNNSHEVKPISRDHLTMTTEELAEHILDADIIINLAGAPIAKYWTASYKKEIYNSRIDTTKKLVAAMQLNESAPSVFMSTSAVGIYDNEHQHSENKYTLADGFLSEVCQDWESEAMKMTFQTRVIILRFGSILGDGGALKKMIPIFKFGLGGRIGNGKQLFPWMHIQDVVEVINYLINNKNASGVFNMVAPEVISNYQFSKILAESLKRPLLFTIPNFDRNWEGTMSDLMYDPDQCRNITLDIRYCLFIIDKFAGAGHLVEEMNIIK